MDKWIDVYDNKVLLSIRISINVPNYKIVYTAPWTRKNHCTNLIYYIKT